MVRWLFSLTMAVGLIGNSWAQGEIEPLADPQNVAEVLTELDAAGTPATRAEIGRAHV